MNSLTFFFREVSLPVPKGAEKKESETKTVKHVLNYVPFQAAYESDPSQLSKRSWQRIKSHFVMMKSNYTNKFSKHLNVLSLYLSFYSLSFVDFPITNEA